MNNKKFNNTCLIISFFLLLALIVVPQVIDASVSNPDTLTIIRVDAYEGILQSTDQLYIIQYNIEYTGTPPTDTANDNFLMRFMDSTNTQLSAVNLSGYFNNGYAMGISGIYFSASEVNELSIDFGPGFGYYIQLIGNPMVDWVGTPPYTNQVTFGNYYDSDIMDTLYTRLSNQFTNIENDWGEDLIEGPSGEKTLTADGEDYATEAISNLRTLCPDIFSSSAKEVETDNYNADIISDFYIGGDNANYSCYGNNWLAQTFEASIDYEIDTISIKSNYVGTAYDLSVRLYNYGTKPGTTLLTSGTLTASNLLESPAQDWENVSVTPYSLTEGNTYTIVICMITGDATHYTNWRYDTTGSYDNGSAYTSANGGTTWTNHSSHDFQFQTSAVGAYNLSYLYRMQHMLDDSVFDPEVSNVLGWSSMWIRSMIWMAIAIVVAVTVAYESQNSKPITPIFFWFTSAGYFVGMINPYIALAFALLGGMFAIWMGMGRLSSA